MVVSLQKVFDFQGIEGWSFPPPFLRSQVGKKGLDWQLSQNLVLITSPASDASADSDKAPELPWPVQGDKVVQVNQRLEAAAPLFWCPV